jgi:hypothetical protein
MPAPKRIITKAKAPRRSAGKKPASRKSMATPKSTPKKPVQPDIRISPSSKQAVVLAMLHGTDGATIDAIAKATGWQQHSVRGFLAGVVKKKLGLNVVSTVEDGQRTYRILSTGKQA